MKKMMLINDIVWIITAICCVFFEHPVITGIVVVTTIIYAIDLCIKFKHSTTVKEFLKNYWLDILFLIPVCKLFRGFRIIKVGRMLRAMDALNDLTELVFRFYNAICKVKDSFVQD